MSKKYIILIILCVFIIISVFAIVQVKKGVHNYIHNLAQEAEIELHKFDPENWFTDKDVIQLCYASGENDTVKIDELIKNGVDVNAIGKDGLTPLLWLFLMTDETENKKGSFAYLLKNGADPTLLYTHSGKWTALHTAAMHRDSDYLKIVLESKSIGENINMMLSKGSSSTALEDAKASDRFINYKMLLDYGADPNFRWSETGIGNFPLFHAIPDWKYVYELLIHDVDYNIDSFGVSKENPDDYYIVKMLKEGKSFVALASLDCGISYRKKVIDFLVTDGLDLTFHLPEDEKFITENDELTLYTKEIIGEKAGQWVKFTNSSRYHPKACRPENGF